THLISFIMSEDCVPSAATMPQKTERVIKKIPGKLPPPPKENIILMGDLSKKGTADLLELLERQIKILSNKSLVNKLADKGEKVSDLKNRIEKELKSRDELDNTANLLSNLTLNQLNALEWTGHCNPGHRNVTPSIADHPDIEENDPLKILATHSGTTDHKKQISILKQETTLVRAEDLINSGDEIENIKVEDSMKAEGSKLEKGKGQKIGNNEIHSFLQNSTRPSSKTEPFAHFICERFGSKEGIERFKPNKPLKPFTGTYPIKPTGKISMKPKRYEETNVTPPPAVHADSKLLSLEESLKLQQEQNTKLKEIQIRHAAEKLSSLHGIRIDDTISTSVLNSMSYRDPVECRSDSDDDFNHADIEDQEIHDEDQLDRGTTVVYNVES
ncbi:DNA-directed RNA polymerase II subunit GRINL1A, partial [Frankliniella fusca]